MTDPQSPFDLAELAASSSIRNSLSGQLEQTLRR